MTASEFKFQAKIAIANYRHTYGFDPLGILVKYKTYINIKDILNSSNNIRARYNNMFQYEGVLVTSSILKLTGALLIEHKESYIVLESDYPLVDKITKGIL